MQRGILVILSVLVAGCVTNGARIDRLAAAAGMTRTQIESGAYRSLLYLPAARASAAGVLLVFFEGDGRPWRGGREPSADPTTASPLALELLLRTRHPAAYAARPCYHNIPSAGCTPERWTSARYADDIVASMASAVREAALRTRAHTVVLVGYSGGGTLAVLAAERLDNVGAVITVAANLDTDAWTRHHRYLPLAGSLNPAKSTHPHPWPELHLFGERDEVVPAGTASAYFERYPEARRQIVAGQDHTCCWVESWQSLWQRVQPMLPPGPSP